MRETLRSLLAEPRADNPPPRSRWDWVFAILLVAGGVVGAIFEPDVVLRPLAIPVAVVVAVATLWRRSHPFGALMVAYGTQFIADTIAQLTVTGTTAVVATALAGIVLNYGLLRWGSGREAAVGLIMVLGLGMLIGIDDAEWWEAIAGLPFFLLPAAVGVIMRYRVVARERGIEEARATERERIARELHDTVAHHVSAIAIQAQAGRAMAANKPEAAADVLAVIEDAASATLTDMRRMVGALRAPDPALAPQAGIADIQRLVDDVSGRPRVEFNKVGDLDDVPPSLQAGLYRLTQEAITNARRHARHATRIRVVLEGTDDDIRLEVSDDGDVPNAPSTGGYGLVGMTERASLLGGTLVAGPGPGRGWVVNAVLPRHHESRGRK